MRWCFLLSHAERLSSTRVASHVGNREPPILPGCERAIAGSAKPRSHIRPGSRRAITGRAPALGSATGDLDEPGRASDGSHGRRLATTGASVTFDAEKPMTDRQ